MENIVELINSVGFPIVAVIALFYQNNKNNKLNNKQFDEFQKVLAENTEMLHRLVDSLNTRDKHIIKEIEKEEK